MSSTFLTTILALGMGILFAALNAKYRDVRYVLPFLLQVWMFISPIIYPASVVPKGWRWLLALNPLTGIVEGYRASLFGQRIHWQSLAYSMLFTIMLVYLNGAVLGMSRREINARFDEIVAFAGIERFLETAVKHYSSGMYVTPCFCSGCAS